jgi:hypothetical protein
MEKNNSIFPFFHGYKKAINGLMALRPETGSDHTAIDLPSIASAGIKLGIKIAK